MLAGRIGLMFTQHEPTEAPVNEIRKASVSQTGETQTVEIPADMAFDSTDLTIRRIGDRVILEQNKPKRSLLEALRLMKPVPEDEWLDIDDSDLGPLRDIKL